LPTLGPLLRQWQDEVTDGRGFYVLRGLNAADYTDEQVGTIFWAMGLHLGRAVTQNPEGDLLGHVYDHGRRYGDIDVRGYETNAHSAIPHRFGRCRRATLPAPRKSGGLSSVVSAVTIHNEIAKRHPEYLPALYRGFHYIRREAALTESPVTPHRLPVFGARDGLVSVRLFATRSMLPAPRPACRWSRSNGRPSTCLTSSHRPDDPSRHGPGGRRHPVLQQLCHPALAYRL
jgi:hypothetical protein